MQRQQLAHHRFDLASVHQALPFVHHRVAAQGNERVEPLAEEGRVADEERVVLQQQRHALIMRQLDAQAVAGAHGVDQRVGERAVADLLALGLHVHRARRVKAAQLFPHQHLEALLRRLRLPRNQAQHRGAVAGQPFQIEHLRACITQRVQQSRLARAGRPAHHAVAEARRLRRQIGQHGGAKGLVAAFDQADAKADLPQHQRQRAAALAAAPAVEQGAPVLGLVHALALDVAGDVARDQRGAQLARLERVHLLVHRAHAHALVVVQARPVQGAGQAVDGVFALAAGVDDGAEFAQPRQRVGGGDGLNAHLDFNNF